MSRENVTTQDLIFLRRAIELASEARSDGRHPFGSLIVNARGEVVVEARNNAVRPKGDPTQRAETLACSAAAQLLGEEELTQSLRALYQHGTLRHVRRSYLLDRSWARGLCVIRERPVWIHWQ